MITSWVDLAGAAILLLLGLYYLRRGQVRALGRGGKGWGRDLGALFTALLGGGLVVMGLALWLYSAGFAAISARFLSR